jgi:hypothetical protein
VDFHMPEAVTSFPNLPELMVWPPKIPQRYMVEVWIEKTPPDEVVDTVQRLGVNFVSGVGQTSEVRCRELVERAEAADKPVRILYGSDFDLQGNNMPVAAARKIEFWIRENAPHLDVQLRPIFLTYEQCVYYRLPRKPMKEKTRGLKQFAKRYGEGATELDALEATHPGALARIITEEVERYYDPGLQDEIDAVEASVDDELREINNEVHAEHEEEVEAIRAEYDALAEQVRERLESVKSEFELKFQRLSKRLRSAWSAIADSLHGRYDFDAIDWPEPAEGDEDDDPLFDSTRDYVEQCDRFKQHLGKPTARKQRVQQPRISPEERKSRRAESMRRYRANKRAASDT